MLSRLPPVALALACANVLAATIPLDAGKVTIHDGNLQSVNISGIPIPATSLVPITLHTWSGGNNLVILVHDGAPLSMTAAQRRALLESDLDLGTGLLNPAQSPSAVSASFQTPVINGPGPDMIFFEAHPGLPADPLSLTINGVTRTISGASFGDAGYAFTSHDALSPGGTPTSLSALLNNTLSRAHENISQRAMGAAIDFSDFDVPEGAAVNDFTFGSASASYIDPVLIAGISGGAGIPELRLGNPTLDLIPAADTVRLRWQSSFESRYVIQSSTDLQPGSWKNEIVDIAHQGPLTGRTFIHDLSAPRKFFRVTIYEPPPGVPRPEILLRSSWQTVNIGDIAHSPGVLQLLRNELPHARLTLWASNVDRGVREMIQAEFPGLEIVTGSVNNSGTASNTPLQNAWNRADLLLHGSGPSLVAQNHLEAWRQATNKPYAFEGVTIPSVNSSTRTLLSGAAFVRCRDTHSLANIINAGVTSPVMAFGPDGTFSLALRNESAATAWLAAHGLEPGQYLCVIPRLRWTPYWDIRGSAYDPERDAVNQQFKEIDHAKLREAIIQWVRQTGKKVIACPEMTYQVPLAKELLIDPLPADVKPSVIWKDSYWLTDEAASVYARAAAILSSECHSPIIALANGVPAIYVRQPTDTIKGQMYRDIGVPGWIMEIDSVTGSDVAARVLAIHDDPAAARAYLRNAMRFVQQTQAESARDIRAVLGLPNE